MPVNAHSAHTFKATTTIVATTTTTVMVFRSACGCKSSSGREGSPSHAAQCSQRSHTWRSTARLEMSIAQFFPRHAARRRPTCCHCPSVNPKPLKSLSTSDMSRTSTMPKSDTATPGRCGQRLAPTGFLFRSQCLSVRRFEIRSNDPNCSNQPLPINISQPKSLRTDRRTVPARSMSHYHPVNSL